MILGFQISNISFEASTNFIENLFPLLNVVMLPTYKCFSNERSFVDPILFLNACVYNNMLYVLIVIFRNDKCYYMK